MTPDFHLLLSSASEDMTATRVREYVSTNRLGSRGTEGTIGRRGVAILSIADCRNHGRESMIAWTWKPETGDSVGVKLPG